MNADAFLQRFEGLRGTGSGRWIAKCPAHEDKSPSLSLRLLDDGRMLLHCFAGCDVNTVLDTVNLSMTDLFPGRLYNPAEAYGGFTRERQSFALIDALRIMGHESLICAHETTTGKALSETDAQRATLAARRILDALDTVKGSP